MMIKRLILATLFALGLMSSAQAVCTTGALPFNLQNNTTADATQVMANFNQIGTGVGNTCAGSGANTDITSIGGLTTPLAQSEGGTWIWVGGTSTGSANAQVVASVTPSSGFSLTQGKCIEFTPGFVNTGATTLNVFGTGAIPIFRQSPTGAQAMTGGELFGPGPAQQVLACYDGFQYELIGASAQFGGFGPLTSLASATTTDLGTIPSHNVNITGTTTITSFGSSASTTFPVYYMTFAGSLTLTQNATSLILPGSASIVTATNDTAWALYLGSGNWFVISYNKASGQPIASPAVRGNLNGLTLSGGGTQTMTIQAGQATSDDFSTVMTLPSTFTKAVGTAWAVGSAGGCLDTGSIAANTWYHFFAIERVDTNVVDLLCSTSATAPTFPTNYTKKRRIGSYRTDAGPNIISFFQNGDTFLWSTLPGLDFNTTTATTATTITLTTPLGVRVEAILGPAVANIGNATGVWLLSSLDVADVAPSTSINTIGIASAAAQTITVGAQARIWTNTSSQIRGRGNNAINTATLQTYGWRDILGRF